MGCSARNVKYTLPTNTGLESGDAKGKLDGSVKFFFGSQKSLQLLQKVTSVEATQKVNIVSYYKNGSPLSSATEFECHAGSYTVGLSLKGDIVKTADK